MIINVVIMQFFIVFILLILRVLAGVSKIEKDTNWNLLVDHLKFFFDNSWYDYPLKTGL